MTPPLPEAVEEAKASARVLVDVLRRPGAADEVLKQAAASHLEALLTSLQAIEEEKANAIHARDTWKAWHDGIVARNATLQSALAEALGGLDVGSEGLRSLYTQCGNAAYNLAQQKDTPAHVVRLFLNLEETAGRYAKAASELHSRLGLQEGEG